MNFISTPKGIFCNCLSQITGACLFCEIQWKVVLWDRGWSLVVPRCVVVCINMLSFDFQRIYGISLVSLVPRGPRCKLSRWRSFCMWFAEGMPKWDWGEIEVKTIWNRSETEVNSKWDPKWNRSGIDVESKRDRSDTEMNSKWDRSVKSKLNRCGTEVRSMWCRSEIDVKPMWNRSETKVKPKWIGIETEAKPMWNRSQILVRSQWIRSVT